MYYSRIFLVVVISLLQCSHHSCDDYDEDLYDEGMSVAYAVKQQFYELYDACFKTTMPNQKFLFNNLHGYINYSSKTTVGFSPKFTTNRKFFANMIGTAAFKNMLEKDVQEVKNDLVRKMRYCDEAVLDANLLNQFYDREVDLSKL